MTEIVISPASIDNLINLGWLREADRGDRERVTDALVGFAKQALAHATKAMVASPPR